MKSLRISLCTFLDKNNIHCQLLNNWKTTPISTSAIYLVECRQRKFLKDPIYHINNISELKNETKQSTVKKFTGKCVIGNQSNFKWLCGDMKFLSFSWMLKNISQVSKANEWKFFFNTRNPNKIPNHFIFTDKGIIYYVTNAKVIFSYKKITFYFYM